MVVFLGKGYALWRGVVGPCPGCPEGGGEGRRGVGGTQHPVTCPPWGGYRVLPWSDLMIRVGRPWNLLLLLVGPGPPGLYMYMYILVLLTRHFFNPHTAHSDVGGTEPVGKIVLNNSGIHQNVLVLFQSFKIKWKGSTFVLKNSGTHQNVLVLFLKVLD